MLKKLMLVLTAMVAFAGYSFAADEAVKAEEGTTTEVVAPTEEAVATEVVTPAEEVQK